ncbi:MAG: hypothetical protein ACE5E1_07100 [Phycisphaerae bacterium]
MPAGLPDERPPRSTKVLRVAGVLVLALAVPGGVLLGLAEIGRPAFAAAPACVAAARVALLLAAGLTCAGILVGLALLLRELRALQSTCARLEDNQSAMNAALTALRDTDGSSERHRQPGDESDSAGALSAAPWNEIRDFLADIRDNTLLSDAERAEKKLRVAEAEIEEASANIRSLTLKGEFARTREIAEAIQRKYPNDERVLELVKQVEEAREEHEAEDVRACTRQVEDLISISAWDRARELAEQLQQRHPDSVEARRLLLRIAREHRLFEEEQRRRMNAEVQRFVTRRRWEEALAAAHTFIERFPGCEEAEAVRMQVPTLEANAEIEVRQRLEAKIMDFARHGRYIEAVELARQVIERFPGSPQAEALRKQIDRLQELADDPGAAPARIRID